MAGRQGGLGEIDAHATPGSSDKPDLLFTHDISRPPLTLAPSIFFVPLASIARFVRFWLAETMADSLNSPRPVQLYRSPLRERAASIDPDCVVALKALGEDTRVRIIGLLMDAPLDVSEISRRVGVSQYNVSKHLRILREAGLLQVEKTGRRHLYALAEGIRKASRRGQRFGSRLLQLQVRAAGSRGVDVAGYLSTKTFHQHRSAYNTLTHVSASRRASRLRLRLLAATARFFRISGLQKQERTARRALCQHLPVMNVHRRRHTTA